MATDPQPAPAAQEPAGAWPLRFSVHSFGVYTYDTYGARVDYAGRFQRDDPPEQLQRASASYEGDYREAWGGRHIGIHNFPAPARVSWRSKDGQAHEAVIDIADLFADQRVLHNVPRQDIDHQPDNSYSPHIAIEINDRTLRVWMVTTVFTKEQQIPGNRYSYSRREPVLVKTLTF